MEEIALFVWQASTNLQQVMVIARTGERRASTGMPQDKPLKYPAWPAARGSTGWEQEDPVKNRVWTVPRTRTRLLRALLKPPALAMQAMVATPGQVHAQRA